MTWLLAAINGPCDDVVFYLINNHKRLNIDINAKSPDGLTALDRVIESGDESNIRKFAQVLIENGALVDEKTEQLPKWMCVLKQ